MKLFKSLTEKSQLPSLLTFIAGAALFIMGSVCVFFRPPVGLFILLFGVFFLVIGGLTLLFSGSGVKLRVHHAILNTVGFLLIFFAMLLVFGDSSAVLIILVAGIIFLVFGCFPWSYKLPCFVSLFIGGILLAGACLAGLSVPLIIGSDFEDGEIHGFLIHLINFTLGTPGVVLISASLARFFRGLLFNKKTRLENTNGGESL